MLRDYRPSKNKETDKSKSSKKRTNLNAKWLIFLVLIISLLCLLGLLVKTELSKFYQLKNNEYVLLLKNQRPLASLMFNTKDKQLIVTDLRQFNFDFTDLNQEASLDSNLKKTLFYDFLLGTIFDDSYEYPSDSLDKNSLLSFFKNHQAYYFFLKNKELIYREQKFSRDDFLVSDPVFSCPIVLVNTTSEPGLANYLADMLEKSAFLVIKKDSNSEDLAQTQIVFNPQEENCQLLLSKLQTIVPAGAVITSEEETENRRAAAVIYIGKDLADSYNFFMNKVGNDLAD